MLSVRPPPAAPETQRSYFSSVSQEDYDRWRYRYPEFSNSLGHIKPIFQELSDILVTNIKAHSKKNKNKKS